MENCKIHQMSISWILIDVKFIFKMLEIVLRESSSFPGVHLCENGLTNEVSEIPTNGTRTSPNVQIFRFSNMKIFLQDAPTFFLYFLKYFGDK